MWGWLFGLIYIVFGEGMMVVIKVVVDVGVYLEFMDLIDVICVGLLCMVEGVWFKDVFVYLEIMLVWFIEVDFDFYIGEFECFGFGGLLSFYYNIDNDWYDLVD